MPCPLCFSWATSDFICLLKRVCFQLMLLDRTDTNLTERQAREMGGGGLPGIEMVSPPPRVGPSASPPQFTQVNKL